MTQVSLFNGGWGNSGQGKSRPEGQERNLEPNRQTGTYCGFFPGELGPRLSDNLSCTE